jgi:hypothetical protein
MEIGFVEPVCRSDHIVVEQSDRAESVSFSRSVFTDDGIDAFGEFQFRVGEVPIVDEAEFGDVLDGLLYLLEAPRRSVPDGRTQANVILMNSDACSSLLRFAKTPIVATMDTSNPTPRIWQ